MCRNTDHQPCVYHPFCTQQLPSAVPVQAEQQLTNSESARLRMEDLHEEALARIDLLADSLEAAESQASKAQVCGGTVAPLQVWCRRQAPSKPCMPWLFWGVHNAVGLLPSAASAGLGAAEVQSARDR